MKKNLITIVVIAAVLLLGLLALLRPEPSAEALSSDKAWLQFSRDVAELGELVQSAPVAQDERTRAEGYRSIGRLLTTAMAHFSDHNRPEYPNFLRFPNNVARIGWDNPDNIYYSAPLRGDHEYWIRGNLGTARFSSFMMYSGIIGYTPITEMRLVDGVDSSQLQLDENGNFEIYLSAKPHAGNWLQLAPDVKNIIIRQMFDDWQNAQSGWLEIINLTTLGQSPAAFTAAQLQQQLASTIEFVTGIRKTLTLATRLLFSIRIGDNELLAPKEGTMEMSDPSQQTSFGHFKLSPEQALIISFPKTECLFTNIQLANPWQESLDYTNFQVHLNNHSTRVDSDGVIRYVISAADPGVPNWLDTTGLAEGSIFARWTLCQSHPQQVDSQLVELSQLSDHLPTETPVVSKAERDEAIAIRRQAMSRRYAGG